MFLKSLSGLLSVLEGSRFLDGAVQIAGNHISEAINSGNKVMTAGNGGSAAESIHLAEELVGRFSKDRPSWPAISLASDASLITCIANDYGFDSVFSRQIEGLGNYGDVLVVFTTSGNSRNIVSALRAARKKKVKSIALLGKTGGAAKDLADHSIIVPSDDTARVQEVHGLIIHSWLSQLELNL
jgi:D-sedoheptulose 7-phosphate isomerase